MSHTRSGNQLIRSVREQVERPFQEKLRETIMRVKMHSRLSCAAVSCSFGKDSMIVTDLALRENPKIPVVFENTLIEFPETMYFARKVVQDWNINYVELKPSKGITFFTVNDRIRNEGLNRDDGRKHSNLCCYWLKERPFRIWRKQHGITKSLTGITAVESYHRMHVACRKGAEYFSFRDGLYKINPLSFWTEEEVWDYTHDNGLPVNPAYEKYSLYRIGCMWCMAHKGWRKHVCRINPKMYAYMMKRYFGTPVLYDDSFQTIAVKSVYTYEEVPSRD